MGAVLWTQCGQAGHSSALLGLIFQWETDNAEIKKKVISKPCESYWDEESELSGKRIRAGFKEEVIFVLKL